MNKKIEINNSVGTIRNINWKKIKNSKLVKYGARVITGAVIIGIFVAGIAKYKEESYVNPIPENQTKIVLIHEVETDDNLTSIVNYYYNEDCEGVYRYPKNYMNDIMKQNNVYSHIERGDKLEIPVIVDNDNIYYVRILEIENRIKYVEENNLWVSYVVQPGDSLYSIAEKASGDITETPDITQRIASKNNMSLRSILNSGTTIKIMNPELGELKSELNEVKEQLRTSIISGEKTK